MVHLYIGTGKGKTSAAIGLAIRAAGWKKRVYLAQFLKSNKVQSGEVLALQQHLRKYITVERFINQTHPIFLPKKRFNRKVFVDSLRGALVHVSMLIHAGKYDVVILDELLDAVSQGFIPEQQVIDIFDLNPLRGGSRKDSTKNIELVFTGRKCSRRVKQRADYVSKIIAVKHPFTQGIQARKGIEY